MVLLAAFCLTANAQPSDTAQARAFLEEMAQEVPYLNVVGAVTYDNPDYPLSRRSPWSLERLREIQQLIETTGKDWKPTPEEISSASDDSKTDVAFPFIRKVTRSSFSKEALLGLLAHENPKVRTLAAVALYAKDDPFVLPELAKLSGDQAITFMSPAGEVIGSRYCTVFRKQTVGEAVKWMLWQYLSASGSFGFSDFDEYWKEHENRTYSAGWFKVQLERMVSYTELSRDKPSDAVMKKLNAWKQCIEVLPEPDRAWTKLFLGTAWGWTERTMPPFTTEEMLEAGRLIGPENLMRMLQGENPSGDPALQPRDRAYSVGMHTSPIAMNRFVLSRAAELLRPEDSAVLLKIFKKNPAEPWPAVGAAQLQPQNASRILHDAWKAKRSDKERWNEYAEHLVQRILFRELWRQVGISERAFLVDMFYRCPEAKHPFSTSHEPRRSTFLHGLSDDADAKELIAGIVVDPRFLKIDPESLSSILLMVWRWNGTRVTSDDERSGFFESKVDADKLKETQKRLIESAPQWLGRELP